MFNISKRKYLNIFKNLGKKYKLCKKIKNRKKLDAMHLIQVIHLRQTPSFFLLSISYSIEQPL